MPVESVDMRPKKRYAIDCSPVLLMEFFQRRGWDFAMILSLAGQSVCSILVPFKQVAKSQCGKPEKPMIHHPQ
jgi:hypothetical protein